ncbi:MAG: Crp/Fnr family transcriptional regulator [Candidatus Obscuribacterales bacterium]|nr:Crp/Fnr family transcriptional regulator [Candidatus Obscuribacterales bacterium]
MSDDYTNRNLLLNRLPAPVVQAILGAAEFVHIDMREGLFEPNKPIEFVDFPESGVMCLLTPMSDGSLVEIATIGREGMVGVSVALGVPSVGAVAFCQVPGTAWRLPRESFQELVSQHGELGFLSQRYAMALFEQVAINTGCNRTHTVEERCARWLLLTRDRCDSDEFPMTQDFLATMLGVSRTGINLVAGMFSKAKLISYVRGRITILDRPGLEEVCCDCYFMMRKQFDRIVAP